LLDSAIPRQRRTGKRLRLTLVLELEAPARRRAAAGPRVGAWEADCRRPGRLGTWRLPFSSLVSSYGPLSQSNETLGGMLSGVKLVPRDQIQSAQKRRGDRGSDSDSSDGKRPSKHRKRGQDKKEKKRQSSRRQRRRSKRYSSEESSASDTDDSIGEEEEEDVSRSKRRGKDRRRRRNFSDDDESESSESDRGRGK